MTPSRQFKAVYFPGNAKAVTVSLGGGQEKTLARRVAKLSSAEIRAQIGISTYKDLIEAATDESRTVSGLVKQRLIGSVERRKTLVSDRRKLPDKAHIKRWIAALDAAVGAATAAAATATTDAERRPVGTELREIRRYLKQLIS